MDNRILGLLKDARRQLEHERQLRTAPIAIVGIGCRFPGGASSPARFWQLLQQGTDATSEVPPDRWDAERHYDPDPEAPGKTYVKRGGFLERIDGFDAEFFGISPREALGMDPQQRLLLEVSWEALEDAGCPTEQLRGSATGVWVGLCVDDYARRSVTSGDLSRIDPYSALGNTRSIAAGRIAYVLDLRGPVIQLDTACSSSLVAVHQACQSLRSGEANLALAGGVNLMASPEATIALCKLRALARDGRCKTFDASADGYARGEGCGMVVLKRLADAQAAGDRIYAVIRGSAVNHDGRSNGLTAPNGLAQEAVIRSALSSGGLEPKAVGYVEAHGTGTLLGDPVEVLALSRVYGQGRSATEPLHLGTVKANFGHLEGAAGIAGVIKAALCLAHGRLVPQLNLHQPNPKIPWDRLPVRVAIAGADWPRAGEQARFAGVSSFGLSGTNAHAILEEPPRAANVPAAAGRSAELVLLSAKSPAALRALAAQLHEHVASDPGLALPDVAYTLLNARSLLDERLAFTATDREVLLRGLLAAARGEPPPSGALASARPQHGTLGWLFTGQGAQQLGMGRALYDEWPAFRSALDAACSALDPHLDRPLRDVMWAAPGSPQAALIDQTAFTQPALFALEWALAQLWRSWGVEPDALLGHSIGEISAATVAGVFSLEDAARLVCARGRLMQALPASGAMVSIAAPESEVSPAVARFATSVSVAAVNGPASTVVSGVEADVLAIADVFAARGIQTKRLTVSHAFHSPLMDPMLAAFREVAQSITYHPPSLRLVSNLSGDLAGDELCTPEYWVQHVRKAVRFSRGVQALYTEGVRTFLELGPKPTLLGLVPASLSSPVTLLSSLRSGRAEPHVILEALGSWLAIGGVCNPVALFPNGGRRIDVPTYPWQHQRYWQEAVPSFTETARPSGADIALGQSSTHAPANSVYCVEWQAIERPVTNAPPAQWLILPLGAAEEGSDLARTLRARGQHAAVGSLAALPSGLAGAQHVVCLGSVSAAGSAIQLAQQGLAIVQSLAGKEPAPRVWWVTQHAVTVDRETELAPASATLWGLGRTLMAEHPELRPTLIDIEPDAALDEILCAEASATDEENQLAWRRGRRYAARLTPASNISPAQEPTRGVSSADHTVLITGGLGALGLELARHCAKRGTKHFVLTGRRGLDTPGASEALAELRALGAVVTVAPIDVTDRAALARVLSEIPGAFPLRGVIHAAGVVDDGLLVDQSAERFFGVLAPKVSGALYLDELTRDIPLDFFILFSSIAGTFGSASQGAYAAANAFLDALAAQRRAKGLPAQSLAWGPWSERGMAAALGATLQARFARQGLALLSASQGLSLFDAACSRSEAHLLLVPIDRTAAARAFGDFIPALWRSLLRVPARQQSSAQSWARELAGISVEQRQRAVSDAVRAEVARVLALAGAEAVPRDRPLRDLGLDSLMAVELRNSLARRAGINLSATVVFDHPTPDGIAMYLLAQLRLAEQSSPATPLAAGGAAEEPIAIVGIGCRFPGGISDPDSFWRLLDAGIDAVSEIPKERWDIEKLYDPDPSALGKISTRNGGFLRGIDQFEPTFFGISPREAEKMDPQQRLLLEVCWEALERAQLPPETLMGSNTGVFVGLSYQEYATLVDGLAGLDGYVMTGNTASVASGRISYVLGLRGPSLTIDTACSSSLVTLHLACQALRQRECDLALAGGVALMLTPAAFVEFSRLRGLASDGRCKTFSADADGTGWSEGCGMLVLERVSDARRNGHPILALVRGTAVNQDGRSNGLTAPNGPAQQAVIRDALQRARVAPADVGFVECHGTGTSLGDPVEVQALAAALASGRPPDQPVILGALKSNLGHTQAAAGVAGVIKAVLSLQHGHIPKSLHFTSPNPHIPWSELPVRVASEAMDWPRNGKPRIAGVSSFGISGTNAHALLEEAPARPPAPSAPTRSAELIVLYARNVAALDAAAARLRDHLTAHPDDTLGDLAFSLLATRSPMEHRLTLVTSGRDALAQALDAAAHGETPAGAIRAVARDARGTLGWLFTGQGAQQLGMGRALYDEWPAFRSALDAACSALDPHLARPLKDIMWADPASPHAALIDQTAFTQPALFALEWALAQLWRSWGVEPDALLGHSIGEISAATVAGVFSLEDAARLVCARGRLMQALPAGGAMVSIAASEGEVAPFVSRYAASVAVAALNSPASTVISGVEADVLAVADVFAARGIQTKRLTVSHAFHSPLMDPMLAAFREVAQSVTYHPPSLRLVSNLSGELAGDELCTPEYWVQHVRKAVRFSRGVQALYTAGVRTFLELGPKPTLLGLASATLPAEVTLLPSLRSGRAEPQNILEALGGWLAQGGSCRPAALFPSGARAIDLPTYPWQRQRYWIKGTRVREADGQRGRWSLSGSRMDLPSGTSHHVLPIGTELQTYLRDHRVHGAVVVPGAFYVSLMLAAASEHWPDESIEIAELEFVEALVLEPGENIDLHLLLRSTDDDDSFTAELATRPTPATSWTVHARARLQRASMPLETSLDLPALLATAKPTEPAAIFDKLAAVHVDWGPSWRWMKQAWAGADIAGSELVSPTPGEEGVAPIHPILLDNGFATFIFAFTGAKATTDSTPWLPFAIGRMRWLKEARGPVRCAAQLDRPASDIRSDSESLTLNLSFWDAHGELVALIEKFSVRRAPRALFLRARKRPEDELAALHRIDWKPIPPDTRRGTAPGRWLLVTSKHDPDSAELRLSLEALGMSTVSTELPEAIRLLAGEAVFDGVVCAWDGEGEPAAAATRLAHAALNLSKALVRRAVLPRVYWVTRGAVAVARGEQVAPAAAVLWGLGRTLMLEHPELDFTLLDIEPNAHVAKVLPQELSAEDRENQVAWRGGARFCARLVRTPDPPAMPASENYQLETSNKGTLDNLGLVAAARMPPGPGEVEICVAASGLNFRDVLNALGLYPGQAGPLGTECSGAISAVGAGVQGLQVGDKVMALAPGAFRRFVTVDARLVSPIPAGLSLEQAASVPTVFLTAWYALHDLAQLAPGEKILIHAAAGGVGMAAVQLARAMGAEVLATASPTKWGAVRELGVQHVASSRDLSFQQTFRASSGSVQVVLNSLAGDFIDASLSLLSPGGRFIEMGKLDMRDAAAVAEAHANARYHAFDLAVLNPDRIAEMLASIRREFEAKRLKPLPLRVFKLTDAESAFRFVAQARHIGKVVLLPAAEAPRAEQTVLITGGVGALGLEVARHLAARGVKHLLLTSRRGLATPGTEQALSELRSLGARVTVAAVDVADRHGLSTLLESVPPELPLRGVIHAAGLVDDGLLVSQTEERFSNVLAPKVAGAVHLHELTRDIPLDFFVLFSSVAGSFGSPAQAAYSAANAFLDALAAHRHALALPATSLGWGAWSERGMAASLDDKLRARFARQGLPMLTPSRALALFDSTLRLPNPHVIIAPIDRRAAALAFGSAIPPLWRSLLRAPAPSAAISSAAWARELLALPADNRTERVLAMVRSEAARILSLNGANDVPSDRPLQELGLDSLMAAELRNALRRQTGITLSAVALVDSPSPAGIADYILTTMLANQAPAVAQSDSHASKRQSDAEPVEPTPSNGGSGKPIAPAFGAANVALVAHGERLGRVQNPRARLFCFHDAGGDPTMFAAFGEALAHERVEVHALGHARDGDATEARANRYLDEVCAYIASASDVPYALFGHSLGALFAMRVIQRIARQPMAQPALYLPSAPPSLNLMAMLRDKNPTDAFRMVFGEKSDGATNMRADFTADLQLWHSIPQDERMLDVPIAAFLGSDDPIVTEADVRSLSAATTRSFSLVVLPGDHFYLYRPQAQPLLLTLLDDRLRAVHASKEDRAKVRSVTRVW